MTIEITELDQLDSASVQQTYTQTKTRIQEAYPTADLKIGGFSQLIAYLHAQLATGERVNINRYLNARSLLQIGRDPTLAGEEEVDHVLSNFGLERTEGTQAEGQVTIVVDDDVTVTIARGAIFTVQGKQFTTSNVYIAKADETQIDNDSDRLLRRLSDGNWAFVVDVVAAEAGSSYKIKKDTLVAPAIPPRNFVAAYATADFTDGLNSETNSELLARQQTGIATKTLSNRVTMDAMLQTMATTLVASSIIGHGDAEMTRDQTSIFPGSLGGSVDWYVRTELQLVRTALTKQATLIEKTDDGRGIWQFSVLRDDAPGFYDLHNIRLPAAENVFGGFEIVSETRQLDTTGELYVPDMPSLKHGIYSRYQTATVQFKDTTTATGNLAIGDKQEYSVEARGLPELAELQDTIGGRSVRPYGSDILIRAPMPAFVSLTFSLHKRATQVDPDVDGIKDALVAAVNRVDFIGRLDASLLTDVIYSFLANDTTVGSIDMFVRLRYHDGSIVYLRDDEVVVVPHDPANLVTSRTTQFFLDPEDIAINILTTIPEP